MTLPLFASCMGVTHPRNRGQRYREVLADLTLQFKRDSILRLKTKPQRKRARSMRFKKTAETE